MQILDLLMTLQGRKVKNYNMKRKFDPERLQIEIWLAAEYLNYIEPPSTEFKQREIVSEQVVRFEVLGNEHFARLITKEEFISP